MPEQLTLFQGAGRASPGQPPESSSAKTTQDISGRKCLELYEKSGRESSLVRTLLALLNQVSTPLPHSWRLKATPSKRLYFQLVPLVLRTGGTASGLWPTPVAQDDNKTPEAHLAMKARMPGGERTQITSLNVMVKAVERGLWPTPSASLPNDGEEPETWLARRERAREKHSNGNGMGMPPAIAVKLGPTPKASEGARPEGLEAGKRRLEKHGICGLSTAVRLWPTPNAQGGTGFMSGSNRDTWRPTLEGAVQMAPEGPPPVITAEEFRGKGRKAAMTKLWPTPRSSEGMAHPLRDPEKIKGNGKGRLEDVVALGHTPKTAGGSLSPAWVEALLGYPPDWTSLIDGPTEAGKTASPELPLASPTG